MLRSSGIGKTSPILPQEDYHGLKIAKEKSGNYNARAQFSSH